MPLAGPSRPARRALVRAPRACAPTVRSPAPARLAPAPARLAPALAAFAAALVVWLTTHAAAGQTPLGSVDPSSPWVMPGHPTPASFPRGPGPAWAPSPAPADAPTSPGGREEGASPFALDLAAVTHVPLLVGGQATLELPARLLLQGEVGVLPGAYVDAADAILVGAGAYDAAASELVRSSLDDSLVVRLSGGVRPFRDHGLEILGGYTMSSLGAGVTPRDAVEAVSGVTLPATGALDAEVRVSSTVHAVHVALGWRWGIGDHLSLRASLGYLHAMGASSAIELPSSVSSLPGAQTAAGSATSIAEGRLDELLVSHVRLPLVGLSVGYRF